MKNEFNNTQQRPDIPAFFKAPIEEKRKALSNYGIVLGTEHIGTVVADGQRAVINGLINPFNGEKLEACFTNEDICLTEGDKVAVRLQVMTVKRGQKGLDPSPDNIFTLEYICLFNENADRIIKHLKGEVEKCREEIQGKNATISQLREQNQDLRKKADDSYIQELESKVQSVTQKNQELKAEVKDQIRNHIEQLEENGRIADIIIERGITTLVHVTHIDNLESILEKGIIPRETVPEGAVTIDPYRSEGKWNCNCLSVERPNSRYFGQHAYEYGGTEKFVCLCIKPTILLDGQPKHYCPYNAATNSVKNKIHDGQLTSSNSFQGMFADHISEYRSIKGWVKEVRNEGRALCLPTSVQAEILYEGIIKPENILSVDFPSERAREEAQDILDKYGANGTVRKRFNF